ncbi:MAG TPA: tetratricopeptide repeat protein [Mucilaginibacter sp.]
MTSEELLDKAKALNDEKKYQEVIDLLTDKLLDEKQKSELYAEKAKAYWRLNNYKLCEVNADKALKIEPENATALHYKGNIFWSLRQFENAKEYYKRAIGKNPELWGSYDALGIVYENLNQYDKAIEFYKVAIKKGPENPEPYYNLANIYYRRKNFEQAAEQYKTYLSVVSNHKSAFVSIAKTRLDEINKIAVDDFYGRVKKIVAEIKKILLYQEKCVTHYTTFSASHILLLDEKSTFRLSEGTFLNDSSEGRVLFDYLPSLNKLTISPNKAEARPFAAKPFIGSLVSEDQYDDLTLWRMYGKEDDEEAKGCAITIEREKLLNAFKSVLFKDEKLEGSTNIDEELSFYRVAYLRKSDNSFKVPGLKQEGQEKLLKAMEQLSDVITNFVKSDFSQEQKKNIEELLNSVAYLFKTYAYQYENEVRLVVHRSLFERQLNENLTPPKVFISPTGIRPFVAKITLGPRMPKAEEWAAAFHYNLNKSNLNPEIYISQLPFK